MFKKYFCFCLFFFLICSAVSADVNTYFKEGNIYFNKGKYDDAIKSYKDALRLDPKVAEINYNIGVAYLNKGNNYYDIAKGWLKKAIELNPNLSSAYYNLGYISLKQKKYEDALSYLDKAIELNPKDEPTQIAIKEAEKLKKEEKIVKEEVVKKVEEKKEKKQEVKITGKKEEKKEVKKVEEKKEIVKIEKVKREEPKKEVKKEEKITKITGKASSYIRKVIFCKDVKERVPAGVTSQFSTSDEKVVLFIEFYKLSGKHQLEINWYTPAGKLYASYTQAVEPLGGRYRTWSYRGIKGYRAGNFKGNWRVKIYLDEIFAKEATFSIK